MRSLHTARHGGHTIRINLPTPDGSTTALIDGHPYPVVIPFTDDPDKALLRARWITRTPWENGTASVTPVPPMNSPTFRAIREYLGLPGAWLADHLGVAERSIRKWDQGEAPIPVGVAGTLYNLVEQTEGFVEHEARMLRGEPGPAIFELPRTPHDLEHMTPVNDFPLDWWRNVGARLCEQVPGLVLEWIDFEP